MKKIILAVLASIMMVACGGDNSKETLYIYSWADYIPASVYEDFEKETGIKVVEDIYSSNEEMYTKIKAGGEGYDIVIPSSDYYEIMLREEMLEKLDKEKLENIKNIDDVYMAKLREIDPNNDYGVPYALGLTGIAVNTKYVKDYPRDYTIFNREDLQGRMTLLDDMREVLTPALALNGYKQDADTPEAMEKAKATILAWKKNIAKFDSESFGKGFASEDFWVVQGYPDNIYRELGEEERANIDLIIPPGDQAFSSIDSFVVLKSAKNKENALKFINFIHRPDVYAKTMDHLELPSMNVPARDLMTVKPVYNIEDVKPAQLLIDIGDKLNIQNKYWQEILIAN
ncbi:MAG: extracellular solute-binding protein [Fusobacterium gastrosuis]|uniref:extracellular solute-binding protein n=1 Tax=Fusobacterium TaxID=848 RepID=UPI001F4F7290|nr:MULTISPECIES: extracellular solute-binding protein [Fusobacterium]MDD7392672.1 extracellular solute-binding protein [Fusobacteriaceae bacterium]MCI5725220.1 extracellular solute-binding protein [Fusobacterium sp.]MCI7223012.1 extracellular solute-binding protein [Fusobacterium sp.]MDD7411180.1 extracellular solute-binding protein [Fusobacteriaceae bacterium]MDY4010323.1 extracellular solute-binding protein [Fusobacterium gastrosuis]